MLHEAGGGLCREDGLAVGTVRGKIGLPLTGRAASRDVAPRSLVGKFRDRAVTFDTTLSSFNENPVISARCGRHAGGGVVDAARWCLALEHRLTMVCSVGPGYCRVRQVSRLHLPVKAVIL